jgi:hypothetical protein
MRKFLAFVPAVAIAALLAVILASCDNGDDSTTNASFYITPASAELVPGQSVSLTAVGGHTPLAWTVSDPTVGQLSSDNGQSVTYMALRAVSLQSDADTNSVGGISNTVAGVMNTVTVTDSKNWTASAVITQHSQD